MSTPGSVSEWIALLKEGDPAAAQRLWECYSVGRGSPDPAAPPTEGLLYRHTEHHSINTSREVVSLFLAGPEKLSSKDHLGGSSWDASVNGPHPGYRNETVSSLVISTACCPRLL